VIEEQSVRERRACRVLSVNQTAYRYEPVRLPDEDEISAEILYMACNFGQVGYCMVTTNTERPHRVYRNRSKRPLDKVLEYAQSARQNA
jgi:hypothetical protein